MNPLESFLFAVFLSLHENNSYIALAIRILQKPFLDQFIHPKNSFLFTDSISEVPQGSNLLYLNKRKPKRNILKRNV